MTAHEGDTLLRDWRFKAFVVLAALIFAAGLWVSFHYTVGTWTLDSDTATTLTLWKGLREHGFGFLSSWYYTSDNWILSLLPLSGLAFELFGTGPHVVTGIGWLIFVASTAMTAWLARVIAGPRLAIVLGCVLIFASCDALGGTGYLAYPVTHNISMAWALLTLLLAVRAVQRGELSVIAFVGICVFANVLSDPWAAAAIALPLFLACGAIGWLRRGESEGRSAALVAIATLLAVVLDLARAYGPFSFLPGAHSEVGGLASAPNNIYWVMRAATHMFNIVPGGNLDAPMVKLLVSGALMLLLSVTGALALLSLRSASVQRQLIVGVSVLSIAIVTAAFILGSWDTNLSIGRFFPNLYFFGALIVVAGLSGKAGGRLGWVRPAVGVYALLFVVSGVMSRPDLWIHREPAQGVQQVKAFGSFLVSNGLTYGYGPYWGAHTPAMAPATDGRVTIRPVSFRSGSVARRSAGSSEYWYRPEDEPSGLTRRFLAVRNDGEECPSVRACILIAERQFGAPSETLRYRDTTILVWSAPIAANIKP